LTTDVLALAEVMKVGFNPAFFYCARLRTKGGWAVRCAAEEKPAISANRSNSKCYSVQ
jgi:hypothetical protein